MKYFSGIFETRGKHYVYKTDEDVRVGDIKEDMFTKSGFKYTNPFQVCFVAEGLDGLKKQDCKVLNTLKDADIKNVYFKRENIFHSEVSAINDLKGLTGPVGECGPVGIAENANNLAISNNNLSNIANDTNKITIPKFTFSNGVSFNIESPISALEKRVEKLENQNNTNKSVMKKDSIEKGDNMNINKMFNNDDFSFGRINEGVIHSIYGLAIVDNKGRAKVFSNGEITDVTGMTFENFPVFAMPVAHSQIAVGDIVKHNGKFMFVTNITEKGFEVVDVAEGEEKSILMTKNVFGFNYTTKVFNMFNSMGMNIQPSESNPFGNPLMIMMAMNDNQSKEMDFSDMMMAMMMTGQADQNQAMNPFMMALLMGEKSDENDSMMKMMLMSQMMANQNKETNKFAPAVKN